MTGIPFIDKEPRSITLLSPNIDNATIYTIPTRVVFLSFERINIDNTWGLQKGVVAL